jgi:hypothetical protein
MATTCKLIAKNVLGSDAATVTLSDIPATYTDLLVLTSARTDFTGVNGVNDYILMRFNGDSGSNYTYRQLLGNGSAASSQSGTLTGALAGRASGSDATASTFGNSETYIPNYAGSTNKSLSTTAANENNGTSATVVAQAALWSNTAAITSILFRPGDGSNFKSGSSFFLYGITKA